MNILIAILMAGFGFSFLYLNWKSPSQETKWINWIGWLLTLSSVVLLILADGIEFGIAYGLFGLALIPLGLVLMNTNIRENRKKADQRKPFSISAIKSSTLKNLSYFIIVVPISLIFSLLTLLLGSSLGGSSEINRLTLIVLGFPFIWALAAYLYLYSQHKKMFGTALTLTTLILCGVTFV